MRAMLNKGWALLYAGIFLFAALTVPVAMFVEGFEAILVTVSSDTVLARPVDSFEGDKPWLTYRYEVEGQSYEGTHSIGRTYLSRSLELDALLIEHSREFPQFSRLEKPSFLGLLGFLLFNGLGALLVFALGLGGALGMYGMTLPMDETKDADEIVVETMEQPSQ